MKQFLPFRLDAINQCLWRRGDSGEDTRILLKPKPFAILRYLVDHAGRLVTHDELLDSVWPDTHVQPEVLKRHILDIRSALDDDPRRPVFIETLPRRGYQFIAPVQEDLCGVAVEAAGHGQDRLVGRRRVLGELREHLEKALNGQRQIVLVGGEPGIGKTRLVDEFQRLAGAGGNLRHARGQCVEGYGLKEPYYVVLEALGKLCRPPGGDQIVQVLASHAPTWLVQFPTLVTRERRETLHRELLGATRERMLREIGEALEAITVTTPMLLVLEDLQWADPSTVDFISALARGRAPAKLMLIGTHRPVDSSASGHPLTRVKQDLVVHQLCREIALEPLAESDVAEYMAAGAAKPEQHAGLAGLVHQHSEGNPLFMVAALEHMTQRGFLSCRDGSWKLNVPLEEIDLEVPENLWAMIEAQIDFLRPEEQRAIEAASVHGVSFRTSVVAVAATLDEDTLEELCEDLSRRQHILRRVGWHKFPNGTISQSYRFRHALYREVFYRRQAPGRRAKLHRRIGEQMEALYANHENEVAAELAEHFEAAPDWPRALKYLRVAADSASRRYAHREAIAILKQAAEVVSGLPEPDCVAREIEVLQQLAALYAAQFDARAAMEAYERLIVLATRHGLIEVHIRALLDMALPAAFTSAQLFLETQGRALQLSADQPDPFLRARTRASCLSYRAVAGQWRAQDAESCWQAIEEIESKGDLLASAEHRLEYTRLQLGMSQHREAHRSGVDSLAILLEQDDFNPYLGILYVKNRWVLLRNLVVWGEWGQAFQQVQAEAALCEKNGDSARAQEVLLHSAFVHLYAMDFCSVTAICEAIFASIFTPSGIRTWHILAGSAQAGLGNYDRALDHLLKVKGEMDQNPMMDDWYQRLSLQAGLTELWLGQGDPAQARQEAKCFLNLALATAERTFQGLAWEANARVAMMAQERKNAEDCIAMGLSTIEGYEVPLAAWRIHGTASELYTSAMNHDLATYHRQLSRTTIMKLANSLEANDALRATFLSAPPVRRIIESTSSPGVRPGHEG
jgi:DNA-binding winged helix-turn-helix (wHTH) protein/tetratricopeptide (TPR) repeat protein